MDAQFEDVRRLAEERFPEQFAAGPDNFFSLALEGLPLEFFRIPGEAEVTVRARLLSLDEIRQPEDFARSALSGNFFWEGTRGATLAVSADNALYLTERREAGDLATQEGLDACIEDFTLTARDWRARSALYA